MGTEGAAKLHNAKQRTDTAEADTRRAALERRIQACREEVQELEKQLQKEAEEAEKVNPGRSNVINPSGLAEQISLGTTQPD